MPGCLPHPATAKVDVGCSRPAVAANVIPSARAIAAVEAVVGCFDTRRGEQRTFRAEPSHAGWLSPGSARKQATNFKAALMETAQPHE